MNEHTTSYDDRTDREVTDGYLKDILHVLTRIQEDMRPAELQEITAEPFGDPALELILAATIANRLMCIQCIGERKGVEVTRDSIPMPLPPVMPDGVEVSDEALAVFQGRQASYEAEMAAHPLPEIRPAVTFSPSWQQTQIASQMGMQMVMTCVALPVCYEHIEVREKTAEEKAMSGGKILPARGSVS
jgi:hypothetical protein